MEPKVYHIYDFDLDETLKSRKDHRVWLNLKIAAVTRAPNGDIYIHFSLVEE